MGAKRYLGFILILLFYFGCELTQIGNNEQAIKESGTTLLPLSEKNNFIQSLFSGNAKPNSTTVQWADIEYVLETA